MEKRLRAENLEGIWAGVTMAWDEKYQFDQANYRANTERMCKAGVQWYLYHWQYRRVLCPEPG